jgi:hypothetical protein
MTPYRETDAERNRPLGEPVEYVYTDDAGAPTIRVTVRGHGADKQVYQHHWDGSTWARGAGHKARTLYRHVEVMSTPKEAAVYVVEGERDVETMRSNGYVATCNIGGAGKWHLSESSASKALAGRIVIVIADADDVGRKHASQAAEHVRKFAASVTGPLECTRGKDVTDHFLASGKISELVSTEKTEPKKLRLVKPDDGPPDWDDHEPADPDETVRPSIMMGHRIDLVVEALEKHMGKLDPALYKRAHELVTVLPAETMPGVAEGTPVIRTLSAPSMLPRITRHVQFLNAGKDDAPPVKVAPPDRIINTFHAAPPWPTIRYLVGVTESPVFRPDGTIRQEPGYDEQTGYLYQPACSYPPVSEHPTQANAKAALAELLDVFVDFPYANDASRLVPISAILSILARPAIRGPIPGHLFDASVVGSGKTLQCDVSHLIATGRVPGHATWPIKEEEQEKLLSTYANATPPGIVIDNVKGVLGGSALEQTLTSETVEFRQFGALTLRTLPWRSVVMVSGNNVALTDDMIRRMLMSRLESPLENPTERTEFAHPELLEWARVERPRLVVAALTMLRAYAAKGFPATGVHLASYQGWARVVAGAIRYAGGGDVTKAQPPRERAALDDSGAAATLAELLVDLAAQPVTIKSILALSYPPPGRNDPPDGYDGIRDAFEALAPAKGPLGPSAQAISKKLSKFNGRWFGNKRLSSSIDAHSKSMLWRVETR